MSRQLGGFFPWAAQRLTAIYLGLFFILSLLSIAINGMPASYEAWHGVVGSPGINLAFMLFIVALLYHAWIGIRDVVVDYVHPPAIKFSVLTFFAVGLIACGLWGLRVLINAV